MTSSRIAVLRPGALGDAVLTLPVLQSLKAARPDAHVLVAGSPVFRLAVECGHASEWVAFDDARLLELFAEGGSCELLKAYDLCIAYGRRADPLLAASLARSAVGTVVQWPSHPPEGTHVVDHLLGASRTAGFPAASHEPLLPPRQQWLDEARAWLTARNVRGSFLALHPGSGGRAKRWPAERFAELASRSADPVVWLLGPAEAGDEELREMGERVGTVAEELPLSTLAGLLARCRAYVGNDSGVTHLAAAVGAPTVALFGPTDPATWAPRGKRVVVLGGPGTGGFGTVSVGQVNAAIEQVSGPLHRRALSAR
jgi:ADP-heptose:LPS heptosyltransferase